MFVGGGNLNNEQLSITLLAIHSKGGLIKGVVKGGLIKG